jgi:hypothetical protein
MKKIFILIIFFFGLSFLYYQNVFAYGCETMKQSWPGGNHSVNIETSSAANSGEDHNIDVEFSSYGEIKTSWPETLSIDIYSEGSVIRTINLGNTNGSMPDCTKNINSGYVGLDCTVSFAVQFHDVGQKDLTAYLHNAAAQTNTASYRAICTSKNISVSGVCPNGVVEPPEEECEEGVPFKSCADFQFDSGETKCVDCRIDVSGCSGGGGTPDDFDTGSSFAGDNISAPTTIDVQSSLTKGWTIGSYKIIGSTTPTVGEDSIKVDVNVGSTFVDQPACVNVVLFEKLPCDVNPSSHDICKIDSRKCCTSPTPNPITGLMSNSGACTIFLSGNDDTGYSFTVPGNVLLELQIRDESDNIIAHKTLDIITVKEAPTTPIDPDIKDYDPNNPITSSTIEDVINKIISIVYWIATSLAFVMIVIGGFLMTMSAGDPQKVAKGRNAVFYAIAGFAVMSLARGIVALVQAFLGVKSSG